MTFGIYGPISQASALQLVDGVEFCVDQQVIEVSDIGLLIVKVVT